MRKNNSMVFLSEKETKNNNGLIGPLYTEHYEIGAVPLVLLGLLPMLDPYDRVIRRAERLAKRYGSDAVYLNHELSRSGSLLMSESYTARIKLYKRADRIEIR